jgi:hypothetical protein
VQSAAVGHHNGTPAHADLHVKPYASRHVKVKADSCRSFSASRAWRGASAPSAEPACCAESAGQGSSRPTAVDRWRPTLQARGGHRQRGRSWVRRGSDGHQLDRMGGVCLPVTTCLVGKGRSPRQHMGGKTRRIEGQILSALASARGHPQGLGSRYGVLGAVASRQTVELVGGTGSAVPPSSHPPLRDEAAEVAYIAPRRQR